jgi:hypothetical protein
MMLDLLSFDQDQRDGAARSAEPVWRLIADTVMGGRSSGELTVEDFDGRRCLRLHGHVSLENNGGFLQAAADLAGSKAFDASSFQGVLMEVAGNDEDYNVHLRTDAMRLPWQSYRARFHARPGWHSVRLPFASFRPYRFDAELDLGGLRRIGVVAIGREFTAELRLARVAFY